MAREKLGKQPVQAKHLEEVREGCGKPRASAGDLSLLIEELDSANAHFRVFRFLHEVHGHDKRVRQQANVGVEQQEIVCVARLCSAIARGRKTPIFGIVDKSEGPGSFLQTVRRSITRSIVHDHDSSEIEVLAVRGLKGRQTLAKLSSGIPVDNYDVEREVHQYNAGADTMMRLEFANRNVRYKES